MARYTSLYTIAVSPLDRLRQLLTDMFHSCSLDVIYASEDYLVARELPGHVSFAQLVTVEVLIDQPSEIQPEVRMSFVVKNEELPLKSENHCHQMFTMVHQAVSESHQWNLIESAAS